jgi:hypothetical protein
MPNTLADAVKDPDFLKAGVPDQMAYIASIDPGFKAASSEDKLAYLNHITGKQAPTTANNEVENKTAGPKEGFLRAMGSDLKGAVQGLAHVGDMISNPAGSAIEQGARLSEDYAARKAEGRSPLYNAAATAVSATPIMNTRPMEEAANRGDVSGVLGHTAVPVLQAAAPLIGEGLVKGTGAARENIGEAIHTPEGELKPMAKHVAQAGGVAAGGALGHAIPIPYAGEAGAALGYKVGPTLMEKMFPKPTPTELSPVSSSPFELTPPVSETEAPIQQSLGLKNMGSGEPPTSATAALPKVGPLEGPVQGPRSRSAMQQMGQILDDQMGAGRAKAPERLPTVATEEPARQMGAPPLRPDVSLRNQPATVEAPVRSNQARLEEKFPDKSVRQMVHANGEEIVDAAGDDKDTLKAIHDLTNPDVRQAMINSGEDMGQTMINNRKASGDMSRQEAFSKLLKKGLTPQKIVELAKQELAAQ